ncbi:hypothetical protein BC008_37070 [Mastigocoleus testarum BC008]|uniref:Uncharacterized protein n=1 Tax=Mastigocoleus testarum BC008 TaxID=371196 RepID=A0A0V8A0H2_9CYAN|nr:hypothetical protein BC008_09110 [Mastigocoleus testarum BC008]KST70261.1 hypothetical protein BC008_37070 [Mastigocoleus testarum BC008]
MKIAIYKQFESLKGVKAIAKLVKDVTSTDDHTHMKTRNKCQLVLLPEYSKNKYFLAIANMLFASYYSLRVSRYRVFTSHSQPKI